MDAKPNQNTKCQTGKKKNLIIKILIISVTIFDEFVWSWDQMCWPKRLGGCYTTHDSHLGLWIESFSGRDLMQGLREYRKSFGVSEFYKKSQQKFGSIHCNVSSSFFHFKHVLCYVKDNRSNLQAGVVLIMMLFEQNFGQQEFWKRCFSFIIQVMDFKRVFVVVSLFLYLTSLANGKRQISLVPKAMNAIIDKHFSQPSATTPGRISITMIGNETKEFLTLMKKLKVKNVNVKLTINKEDNSNANYKNGWRFYLDDSSFVFFDSQQRFKEYATKIVWAPYNHKKMHHLVYAPNLKASDILEAFPNGFAIDNVNFLMNEDKKSIEFVTSFMFTERSCHDQKLKTINRFDGENNKWDNLTFYPQKYRNFHGCILSIAKAYSWENRKGLEELTQFIFENMLNAKIVEINGTWNNCDKCELYLDQSYYLHDQSTNFIIGNPHIFDTYTFVVPPGEPYTDLERMFMMFSIELWIAVGITILIGILVTFILNFVSDKVRKFIAGRDIQSPMMNFFDIFLNGGQVRTPGRNFARFLFILFVLWSLIIRTCHQSMLFELMQADLRRPPIKTLDELFLSDLTLHEDEDFRGKFVQLDEYFWERMAMPLSRLVECTIIDNDKMNIFFFRLTAVYDKDLYKSLNYSNFFNAIAEPSNRVTLITYKWIIKAIEHEKYRSGTTSVVVLEEDYKLLYAGMMFRAFCPYLEIYNQILGMMESNGQMEYWRQNFYYPPSPPKPEDIGPQVLTMDHLRIGFLACCIPAVLSIFAFIGELVWSRIVISVKKNYENAVKHAQQKNFLSSQASLKFERRI